MIEPIGAKALWMAVNIAGVALFLEPASKAKQSFPPIWWMVAIGREMRVLPSPQRR